MSNWDAVKAGLKYTNPLILQMVEQGEKAAKEITAAANKGLAPLEEEAAKQTLRLQLDQQRARVEQELAIARRIDNAEEVEIEEIYNISGKGNLGVTADAKSQTATIGLGAEARHVAKRIYRFKGWRLVESESDMPLELTAES